MKWNRKEQLWLGTERYLGCPDCMSDDAGDRGIKSYEVDAVDTGRIGKSNNKSHSDLTS